MTGESRKCACGRTYTLPLPYDAANPEIRDLCPGLGGVPPCVPAISTPAPEPDEKCEVCGNPLEYHSNAYRWCKNMHSFRYFQNPHTTAPDLHSVIMKTESEIAADKLNEAAYTRGKIDGAKAERERAERILKETLTQIGKEFGQTPHLHTYAEFERRYLVSLRGHEGGQP